MFVGSEDTIFRDMVGVVDMLHQDILGMTLYELDLAVSLSTGAGTSEAHPGVFSLQFLKIEIFLRSECGQYCEAPT